ncbi:alpha/beta hydrolase fold domain-containing protein [Epidermidibacterium keratini]|uniref:Alpha/beta hydrolase fold domain-containing protein n=1 Tax=Epidermidibacterium keratini TaxID=1891644 RepID=A0A7L4YMV8_9ACTN|nr:alpha/beta hydrolase [Epidermidibacterium keratini]QHC00174.1 alpha/beta hydrolase fold domain-containing protein [Epidermidibacterium keratini]
MPVEARLQELLDQLNALDLPPLFGGDPQTAREQYRQAALANPEPDKIPPVTSVQESEVAGPAGPIRIRVYDDHPGADLPIVVFFHGGGWVVGDLDTHDKHARRLVRDVGARVISVDYRRAPEHPFPAAYDDCWAVTEYVLAHPGEFHATSISVAGDSAGGNLAAAVAITARDHGYDLAAQLLIYPATDMLTAYPSREENARGYRLEAQDMDDATASYAQGADLRDPRISPIFAKRHDHLAPAIIGVAGYDPLRDDGAAYAAKLQQAGTKVTLHNYPTLIHGFYGFYPISADSDSAVTELNADLRAVLETR